MVSARLVGELGDCYVENMKHELRITRDPKICGGAPVFSGTRVPLRTVLASLAAGDNVDVILKSFPTLREEDVRAAIQFAAASAEEDIPLTVRAA